MPTLETNTQVRDDAIQKYPCPCCGYLVFEESPGGFSQVCPICHWTDDWVDLRFARVPMGPNKVSLAEAQRNYEQYGASELRLKSYSRLPNEKEQRDPQWRPIVDEDSFETVGAPNPKPPSDMTKLYYWRKDYWRLKVE